jgi:hypothetical protein
MSLSITFFQLSFQKFTSFNLSLNKVCLSNGLIVLLEESRLTVSTEEDGLLNLTVSIEEVEVVGDIFQDTTSSIGAPNYEKN